MEDLLKSNVIKPGSELHAKLDNRMSVMKSLGDAEIYYEEEDVVVNGKLRRVKRLFAVTPDAESPGVGWIINEDIDSCMVCGIEFGYFRWHHHCRSCGNLVCNPCSPETAVLYELPQMGAVRVCKLCYWGQDPVHIAYVKKLSRSSSVGSDKEPLPPFGTGFDQVLKPEAAAALAPLMDYFNEEEIAEITADYEAKERLLLEAYPATRPVNPEPLFVVEFPCKMVGQKKTETLYIYVNVCQHEAVSYAAELETTHIISENVAILPHLREGESTEIRRPVYLAVVDPSIVYSGVGCGNNINDELIEDLAHSLIGKFQLSLSTSFTVLDVKTVKSIGAVTEAVSIPCKAGDPNGEAALEATARATEDARAAAKAKMAAAAAAEEETRKKQQAAAAEKAAAEAKAAEAERLKKEQREKEQKERERRDKEQREKEQEEERRKAAAEAEKKRLAEEARQRKIAEEAREAELLSQRKAEAAAAEAARLAEEEQQQRAKRQREEQEEQARLAERARALEQARTEEQRVQAERLLREEQERTAREEERRQRQEQEEAAQREAAEQQRLRDERAAAEAREAAEATRRKLAALEEEQRRQREKEEEEQRQRLHEKEQQEKEQREKEQREQAEREAAAAAAAAKAQEEEEARVVAANKAKLVEKRRSMEEARVQAEKAKAIEEEEQRLRQEQEARQRQRSASSAVKPTQPITVNLPALRIAPSPWCVIKTKTESGEKVFINVVHHTSLPDPTEAVASFSAAEEAYEAYFAQHFTSYTLGKRRTLMLLADLVETADKDGGQCSVCDVVVASEVYETCSADTALQDKLFIKILKAVKRKCNTDLDAQYKLPKISRNYKGTTVQTFNIPEFTMTVTPGEYNRNNSTSRQSLSRKSEIMTSNEGYRASTSSAGVTPGPTSSTSSSGVNTAFSPASPSSVHSMSPVRPSASSAAPYFTVNAEWNRLWGRFLPTGKNVVYTSQIGKKNVLGVTKVRQLVLSDVPSLIYIDPKENGGTVKGDVEWLPGAPPKASVVDKSNFELAVEKRVFKFTDVEKKADVWVQKINLVAANTSRK